MEYDGDEFEAQYADQLDALREMEGKQKLKYLCEICIKKFFLQYKKMKRMLSTIELHQ